MRLADLSERARAYDLCATPEQRALSARLVSPKIDEIVSRLQCFREDVDQAFAPRIAQAHKNANKTSLYGDVDWRNYPIGFCRFIRDAVFARMQKDDLFRELSAAGVILKPIFIFLQGSYFQNAIQLGHFYLDAANDTVFPEKPKLEWAPLDRVDFENLDTWDRFAEIAKRYLKIEIYPNLYFPLAFVGTPFLAIRPNGRIEMLLAQHQIALKDLSNGLRRTRALLLDKSWMDRRLPPPYLAILRDKFEANIFEAFPLEFKPTSPDDISSSIVSEFATLTRKPDAESFPIFKSYFELIEKATRQFRDFDLRPAPEFLPSLRREGWIPPEVAPPGSLILE